MGRLLIFLGIVLATVIVLGLWGLLLENRKERFSLGLKGSKRKIAALEEKSSSYRIALEEIQSIAEATVTTQTADPMWDLVLRKADKTLSDNNDDRKK